MHDPQTLEVTETYTAPAGINSVFYDSPTMTYFSVEVVNGTLSEHRRDDFSIINSYQLPGAPHHPKGLTMIPNPDGGPPYILVTYYPEPSEGVPGPGPDESGWMLQTLQIVDNQLLLLQTLRAIDGHIFGSGLTWVEQKQMLVTVGPPWLQQGHLGQVGTYLHDNFTGCYLLHGIPPWYVYTYLPIVLRSTPY